MPNTSQVVPLELLPLRTEGRWILDSRSQRFRLKCVNWYGASGELHVVQGLHKRTLSDIVSQVAAWGFNCVRLPFSLELYFTNPHVPAHALATESARGNLTGLEAYDLAVEAITGAGLLVLVDNHSSESGWCCESDAEDGAWFTSHYPETRWIDALVGMARRYRNNPRVFGVDLRNEVRDAGHIQVVWGSSAPSDGRTAADWPAAAERAGDALLAENPSLLIMVTGLCFGQDLRGARERPVELSVPGRLVWTSHSYHWFQWWHIAPLQGHGNTIGSLVLVTALLCALAAAGLLWEARRRERPVTTRQAVFESFCGLAIFVGFLLLFAGSVQLKIYEGGACTDMGQREAEPFFIAGGAAVASALAGLVLLGLLRARRLRSSRAEGKQEGAGSNPGGTRTCRSAHCLPILLCLSLVLGGFAVFFLSVPSHWLAAHEFERHWGHVLEEGQPYTAPVFLGEFGAPDLHNDFWNALVQYIADKDLSFAYWPLNGEKWDHESHSWTHETYGLFADDWTSARFDVNLIAEQLMLAGLPPT